jgi:choline dehydrogenase-like flavoprotein
MAEDADVIVVGGGLAGLVAATEVADAGKRVIVVDQEGEQSLGGQAFWSFGGLFLVDSPEQRRLGIKDSFDLALQDWMGSAGLTATTTIGRGAGPKPTSPSPPVKNATGCGRWVTGFSRWLAGPSAAAMTR